MRRPTYEPPTPADHRGLALSLADLRRRIALFTHHVLSGRVPARVLDAALRLDRKLSVLRMRLSDAVGGEGAYGQDDPELGPAVRPQSRHLGVDEHRALGAELHALLERVLDLQDRLLRHYPKTSRVGRAAKEPLRALDRLRCRLDNLFWWQYPADFDTRNYYPGSRRTPPPPSPHFPRAAT